MPIGTHLIKIQGTFNENWTEEKLKEYVKRKIKTEIDRGWHPDLELFGIEKPKEQQNAVNVINIWVYIQEVATGLANKEVVDKWIKEHIDEEGLTVTNFEIEKQSWEDGFIVELNDVSLESL